jgi:hypothetical protein
MVASGKGDNMSSGNLENFSAYTKSLELFDRVVDEMTLATHTCHLPPVATKEIQYETQ